LVLDASTSGDPDFPGSHEDADLQFVWSCNILDGSIAAPCRYKDETLVSDDLSPQAIATLTSENLINLHLTVDAPYVFTVEVSKLFKTPVSFQMPATLVEEAIPDVVATAASGVQQSSGIVRINPGEQFIVYGRCSVSGENSDLQLKWTFTPPIPDEMVLKLPGVGSDSTSVSRTIRETLVLLPDLKAFVAGGSYGVGLECVDANGIAGPVSSISTVSLSVNAPPRGSACTACRLSGTVCSSSNPENGEPIFDSFQYECPNWADEDGPLEYQFAYAGFSDGGVPYREVLFDWSKSPSKILVLPPGTISLKARVRDSFGASTEWMSYDGGLNVAAEAPSTAALRRRVLSAGDGRWGDATTELQEALDLQDSAKTNQLTSALAIQINDRVAKDSDSRDTAMIKKEVLLFTLSSAAKQAIKSEGYVCEALSAAMAISSEVAHINTLSISHISTLSSGLLASTDASTLAEACAQDSLSLTGKALGATFENETCSDGRAVAPGNHMRQFLTIWTLV